MRYSLDLETTTTHDKIRVGGIYSYDGYYSIFHTEAGLRDALDVIAKNDPNPVFMTWNGSGFDVDVIKRVWHLDFNSLLKSYNAKHVDLMILAKLVEPDYWGGHSLNAWAKRALGAAYKEWKPEDPSWYDTADIADLMHYLKQDLYTTFMVGDLIAVLAKEAGGKWNHALRVEQRVRELVNDQAHKKVRFDTPAAELLWDELAEEMLAIESELEDWLPTLPVLKPKPPPKKQFKQDGTLSALMQKYLADFCWIECQDDDGKPVGCANVMDLKETRSFPLTDPLPQTEKISLSNQTRLKDWLMSEGWRPTWWNEKVDEKTRKKVRTSPRLNHAMSKDPCPDLARFGNQGELISRWLMLRSRRSLLANESFTTGLIPRAKKNGGFLASDADTTGTPTARFRHKGIVNIPSVDAPYGPRFRELFCARPGMKWVGWDASSLEACIEAHYTYPYDEAYARSLVEGNSEDRTDVHSINQDKMGLPNRRAAKIFKYAVTYGAQPPTLAKQLGCSLKQAEEWYDLFWQTNPGLAYFRDDLIKEWRHYDQKRIVGLDGRLLSTRSEHSLINTKFQGGGAILMKHALLLAEKRIRRFALDHDIQAYRLISYHDEEQWESDGMPNQLEVIGEMGVQSITNAGTFLKLNVPITGEYKIGHNWKETH